MEKVFTKEKANEYSQISKLPHLFSTSITMVDTKTNELHSGTVTLYRPLNQIVGITCDHIIKKCLDSNSIITHVGSVQINDLKARLIDRNEYLDIATFKIDGAMAKQLGSQTYPEIGSQCIDSIYPQYVNPEDKIIFGGLPGCWRSSPTTNSAIFETLTIGPCCVNSATMDSFTCRLNDPNSWPWHNATPTRPGKDLLAPGGLSGGPAIIETTTSSGIVHYQLAGIITEGEFIYENILTISATHAKLISPNGKIERINRQSTTTH